MTNCDVAADSYLIPGRVIAFVCNMNNRSILDVRSFTYSDWVYITSCYCLRPQAVARGDINPITIGKRTNVQDGTIIHVTHKSDYSPGYEVRIGSDVTIGHSAIIHACKIEDRVLVGMGSIILDGAIIQHDVMLGAGSLVGPGKTLESGFLYLGSPAKKIRELNEKELLFI